MNQMSIYGHQSSHRGAFQSKNQRELSQRHELLKQRSNTLVPLTVRRPGTLDPYELSYQLVYDINVLST